MSNVAKANELAKTLVEASTSSSAKKAYVKFGHAAGKWYILSIKVTSEEKVVRASRVFGRIGRSPNKLISLASFADLKKIILDRLNHGYTVKTMTKVADVSRVPSVSKQQALSF